MPSSCQLHLESDFGLLVFWVPHCVTDSSMGRTPGTTQTAGRLVKSDFDAQPAQSFRSSFGMCHPRYGVTLAS
jgi:hypothetical protein